MAPHDIPFSDEAQDSDTDHRCDSMFDNTEDFEEIDNMKMPFNNSYQDGSKEAETPSGGSEDDLSPDSDVESDKVEEDEWDRSRKDARRKEMLEHLVVGAKEIKLSYTPIEYLLHILILVYTLSRTYSYPPSNPQDQLRRLVSLSPFSFITSPTSQDPNNPYHIKEHIHFPSLLQLVFYACSLLSTLFYLPTLELILHVYVIWFINIYTWHSIICHFESFSSLFSIDFLSSLVPLAIWMVYLLYLKRPILTIRLWEFTHVHPHTHTIFKQNLPTPSMNPRKLIRQKLKLVWFHLYTFLAPVLAEAVAVKILLEPFAVNVGIRTAGVKTVANAVTIGSGSSWILNQLLVSDCTGLSISLSIFNFVTMRLYYSFFNFQIQGVIWGQNKIGREGVVLWREFERGIRAGKYVW